MGKDYIFSNDFDVWFKDKLVEYLADLDTRDIATKQRINDLITGVPQPSEVVDARGGFPVLGGRLNEINAELEANSTNLEQRSLNVRQPPYNLKADGTLEDMTKLQEAINYAVDNGLVMFFPRGTYLINPISFQHSTSGVKVRGIKGASRSNTILKCNSAGTTFASYLTSDRRDISDITFDANNLCDTVLDVSNSVTGGSNNQSIERVILKGHITTGLKADNFHDSHVHSLLIEGKDKIAIDSNSVGGMVQFIDCSLFGTVKMGCQYASFTNCVFNGLWVAYGSFNIYSLINCYVYQSEIKNATIYCDPADATVNIGSIHMMGTDLEIDTDGKTFFEGRFSYGITMDGGTFLAQRLTTNTNFFGNIIPPSGGKFYVRFHATGIKSGTVDATPQFVVFNYDINKMDLSLEQFRLGDGTRLSRDVGDKEFRGDMTFKSLDGTKDILRLMSDGNVRIGGSSDGGWNEPHLRLGSYHLWVDATGDLRIKSSAPTSDTDGTVVGAQT